MKFYSKHYITNKYMFNYLKKILIPYQIHIGYIKNSKIISEEFNNEIIGYYYLEEEQYTKIGKTYYDVLTKYIDKFETKTCYKIIFESNYKDIIINIFEDEIIINFESINDYLNFEEPDFLLEDKEKKL